jgi:tetratricopeptide (TPR) repeat protein
MAHRRVVPVITMLAALAASLPQLQGIALAAGLDEKGEADAKQATRLYKQGQYQEAAEIFARLSVDYPDMPIFDRNLGACFYHLRKPEPALSNLRRYLSRRQDIAPDDKAVVDRWIDEMEQLRAQNAAASAPPALPPALPAPQPPPAEIPASPAATEPPLAPPAPSPRAAEPAPAAAASIPPFLAPSEAPKPAGVDLATSPAPADSTEVGRPYYKTWWFWTGAAVVVVAGAVTAIYFATRSQDPCSGASLACMGVK